MSDLTLKTKSSTPKQKYVQLTFFCKQHIPIIIENRIDERHLIILINRERKNLSDPNINITIHDPLKPICMNHSQE
jgi:hypothetical protein